jgi:hypothetical protein
MFLIIILFLTENSIFLYNDGSLFTVLVPILLMMGVFFSSFLYKKQLQTILKEENLQSKLGKYQSTTIVRSALLEAPALVSIVATFITTNFYYIIFTSIALLIMLYNFPTKDKFSQNIDLNFEEKEVFKNL